MIKLYAKASTDEQVIDRLRRNADGIEIQIINNFKPISIKDANIVSVHTKLVNGQDTCFDKALRYVKGASDNSTDYDCLMYALELAQRVSEMVGKRIYVVVHVNSVVFNYEEEVYPAFVKMLLAPCPGVGLLLEHNTAVSCSFGTRGVWKSSDLPTYVKTIRDSLPISMQERFGTVLDICHALGNIRIKYVMENNNTDFDSSYELSELDKWFTDFSDTCKLVHVNYGENMTQGAGHGTVPNKDITRELLRMLKTHVPNALYVVEVREESVLKAMNFTKFKETVEVLNE